MGTLPLVLPGTVTMVYPVFGHTPVMTDDDRDRARALSLKGVRPPVKVPGYEQEAFLGHGAYGEVWVAVDSNSGRRVAIKYFNRRGGLDWAALAREVEKLRYLFSNRYVVQLIKVGWEAEPPYYVMEFMENGSLEDLLRHGPLPVHDAVGLFREVAVALVHAHNKGILHCDLKPGNILLDHDRKPRLADFGQSRLTNEASPALGTLFYMAPEQADLAAVPDARWDVYALGAVMYRMLTGSAPHKGDAGASEILGTGKLEEQLEAYRKLIQSAPPPAAHRKVPGVDGGLAAIIDRCLAANPHRRYPNPQAVLTALDAWSLRRVRRPLLAVVGLGFAALLLALAVLGAYVFWTTVSTAQAGVVGRALDANKFAARAEAQQFALEIEHRWRVLEVEARDPRLRHWLLLGEKLEQLPDEVWALDAWLAERRAKYDLDFPKDARSSLWMALDRGGFMRGMAPSFPDFRHHYYGYRDYFTGLAHDAAEKASPPKAVIAGPHRSLVYRRRSTGTWAVTFSVPVPPAEGAGPPLGVLAMSLDLKPEVKSDPDDRRRFSVLVDLRPDGNGKPGVVARHPYMQDLPEEVSPGQLPLYYADRVADLATRRPAGWDRLPDYRDPVRGPEYAGLWLAAAEPVVVRADTEHPVDTGFVVVVQEDRDDVLGPVRALQWRLGYGAAGAAAFVLLLVLAMWGGMMYVLDASSRSRLTLFLRRWAGLPTTGTGTAGTPGTGSAPGTGGTPGSAAGGTGVTPTGEPDRG
jgi:hypothetical protein